MSNNVEIAVQQIDVDSQYLDDIVDKLVESCCKELDEYIEYVKRLLDNTDIPIENMDLDDIILTIPTLLYFAGNAQESLGIREDIAKMEENSKYNRALVESSGTVPAKQAYAKLQVQNESLAALVYQRACKKIKLRCDYACEILQSSKKILSRRVAELELSKNATDRDLTSKQTNK